MCKIYVQVLSLVLFFSDAVCLFLRHFLFLLSRRPFLCQYTDNKLLIIIVLIHPVRPALYYLCKHCDTIHISFDDI